jgi:small conductance mechanosensitive channel
VSSPKDIITLRVVEIRLSGRGTTFARERFMDMSYAWTTTHEMARRFIASLPQLTLAIVLGLLFFAIGRLVGRALTRRSNGDASHKTLNIALGRIAHGTITTIGILIAVATAFPTFSAANVIGALGVGGIAIGFAFKDIFENFLSGVLILITHPFRIGDQIIYDKYEGTVEDIHIRATWLKTYDGRRVVIPNSDLFTHAVTVNTAFQTRRLEYDFKIKQGADIDQARSIVARLLQNTDGVLPDPKAEILVTSFDDASVNLKARWWSKSRIGDVLIAQDHVLSSVRKALASAGIGVSSSGTQVIVQQGPQAKAADSLGPGPVKPDGLGADDRD